MKLRKIEPFTMEAKPNLKVQALFSSQCCPLGLDYKNAAHKS